MPYHLFGVLRREGITAFLAPPLPSWKGLSKNLTMRNREIYRESHNYCRSTVESQMNGSGKNYGATCMYAYEIVNYFAHFCWFICQFNCILLCTHGTIIVCLFFPGTDQNQNRRSRTATTSIDSGFYCGYYKYWERLLLGLLQVLIAASTAATTSNESGNQRET